MFFGLIMGKSFQSTPSVWRETCKQDVVTEMAIISIHSLRMEGDPVLLRRFAEFGISIHSLRMEGDPKARSIIAYFLVFQSTPSVWRETP